MLAKPDGKGKKEKKKNDPGILVPKQQDKRLVRFLSAQVIVIATGCKIVPYDQTDHRTCESILERIRVHDTRHQNLRD